MWYASLARCNLLPLIICEAFVVAWGGTAADAGRIIGLLILSFELKKFMIRRREVYIFWASLFVLSGEHAECFHLA